MQRQYIDIGSDQTLTLEQDEAPVPGSDEILIDVAFAGVNRADVLQRMGLYPVPEDASPIMGLEVAGTVAAVGPGVTGFTVGDRVAALVHGGGYASHAIAREDHSLPVPENLSLRDAAALPEALLTVWHNVFRLGGLHAGQTLLIHGGGSGIGSIGIQMAKAAGATVLATAGGPEKCERVKGLGADHVFDYREDLMAAITSAGYAGRIDVILDMAGGDFTAKNLLCAAPDARVVVIGVMRGAEANIDLLQILMKRLTLTGSTLRGMGMTGRAEGFVQIRETVMPWVTNGAVTPVVDTCFPLADAAAAHELMQGGTHLGKILLDCRA